MGSQSLQTQTQSSIKGNKDTCRGHTEVVHKQTAVRMNLTLHDMLHSKQICIQVHSPEHTI